MNSIPIRSPSRIKKTQGGRAGFSLVEMSVVILVLGILFSMIFGVYFGISQITRNDSPISKARRKALLALDNMRSTINQTFYQSNIKRLVFVGHKKDLGENSQDRLTFAAVHPRADELGVPAVREVSFYLRPGKTEEEGYTLIRREDQNVDAQPGEGGIHYPLVHHVTSLKFRYSLDGKEWEEEWRSQDLHRIPRLVQIQMKVQIGDNVQLFETLSYIGLYIK